MYSHIISPAPSSPRDLQAVSINPEEVSLRWLPSSDTGGSPLSKYRVELRRVSAGETSFTNVAEVDHEGNSYILYTIENLIPENSYELVCIICMLILIEKCIIIF